MDKSLIEGHEQIDVVAIIGGIFVIVPLLWTMKYKLIHNYVWSPKSGI